MKSHDYIYKKILRDVNKYISKTRNDKKLFYTNDEGETLEAEFDFVPTREEIEGLLIFLNKDKIAHA